MVAHECGIPQWYWNGDSGADAWVAYEESRRAVGELNGRRLADKLQESEAAGSPLLFVCEALLIFTGALERADNPCGEHPEAPLRGMAAWDAVLSELHREENYFDSLEARSSPSKLKDVSNVDEMITTLLEACVLNAAVSPEALRKALPTFLAKAATTLVNFLKYAAEVITNLIKDSQVRNCLPRIMSTESYLSRELADLGEDSHASLVSFGKLLCAVERVQWRSNTRAPNGEVEQIEDNVFFAVASDEGESGVLLKRLALLVKESTEMVIGSIHNISTNYSPTPPPALSCVMRALLHSTNDFESPAIPLQGVRSIIRDFTSQSSDHMMRSVDDALADETARGVHCMTFVNVKLASYHTGRTQDGREAPTLSSADVFMLSAYVEGLFISNDGRYYDPGHGAAWDPNAFESESPAQRRNPSEVLPSVGSTGASLRAAAAAPSAQPGAHEHNFQSPLPRPVSPISTPDTAALPGPMKAHLDNLQAMSGQRESSRYVFTLSQNHTK